jgi:formylmethanofuran dehydrogenase subunit E
MGTLEFMNQDGEWEKFPTDEELQAIKELMEAPVVHPPIYPSITTVCHLCNEPFPVEDIVVTGGNPIAGYTWSCPKCHAITSTGKA